MSAGAPDDQQVLGARAWQAMMEADFAEARAFATRGVELSADRVNERATEFPLILAVIGDVEPAAAAIEPVVHRLRQDGAVLDLIKALLSQSLVEKRLGRWASALSAANEAVVLSDEAGIPYLACITVCELASIEGALALESGVAHAQRVMEIAPRWASR